MNRRRSACSIAWSAPLTSGQQDRLQRLRWTETRDGTRRVITAVVPVLLLFGLYLLWRPGDGGQVLGGILLGTGALILVVRMTALTQTSDPALAVPVGTGTAMAVVALITSLLYISGEPAAAVGLALTVLVAGVFILSIPGIALVAAAAIGGFVFVMVYHGGGTAWVLAGAGVVTAVALAGLSHNRQVDVLRSTMKLELRESRHNAELETAFKKARNAELKAKRLSESAGAGLQAQREREALRARMQSILDSAGEGIVGTDRQGRIVFGNEAATRLTGHPAHEMIGQHLHDFLHHSHQDGSPYPRKECPVREVLLKHRMRKMEGEVFWHKDGTSFPVSYVASPLLEQGKAQGAVVVFQDVTERVELEKMKDELVSVVSHELRTPLTSIHGSLKLVMGTMKGTMPTKAQNLIDMASRNTERLIRIVNDLLDLERLRAGRFELSMTPVGTKDLADEAAMSLQTFAYGHGVRLAVEGKDATIVADGQRIHQALVNLISNAVKFSPPGATVRVVTEQDGDRAWFSVVDEGPGIAKQKQPELFQRFSQVDVSDTRAKGGSGLGLAITRGIVEAHGGTVGLASEPGKGSTFYFMVPREPMQKDKAATRTLQKPHAAQGLHAGNERSP